MTRPNLRDISPEKQDFIDRLNQWRSLTFEEQLEYFQEHPMATKKSNPLVIRGFGDSGGGYSRMTCHLMKGIEKLGVPTCFSAIHVDETRVKLDPFLAERQVILPPDHPALVMASPFVPVPPDSALLTMWESSLLPNQVVPNVNQSRVVIVPCLFCKKTMEDSGTVSPLRVVPLGVDHSTYYPVPKKNFHGFTALVLARTAHGGERKGVDDVISVFVETLGNQPDCKLVVKIWPDCTINPVDHPRVIIDRSSYDDAGLADLYRSADIYFSLSRGEGWGMPGLEAMACGTPVVGLVQGGQADYLTGDCCYPVEHDMEPAGGIHYTGNGLWARYRRESAAEQLLLAYRDGKLREEKAKNAAKRSLDFTWEKSAESLHRVLEEFDLIPSDGPPTGATP